MRLLFSPTSPYVRKVRVSALEKGLADRITLQPADVFGDVAAVAPLNPLRKVPTLVLEDGETLYDSPVICEYLDSLAETPRLIPAVGAARWRVLRTQALADGIKDAAFATVMEGRRPEAQRSGEWLQRWGEAIARGVDALEEQCAGWSGETFDLGQIAAACALGYLDFRLPQLAWRDGRERLADWCAAAAQRPSLKETAPPAS